MNGNVWKMGGLILAVVAAILVYASTFVVYQTQSALVLRFGGVRNVITEPGLYFKVPLVENVVYVDKRVLDLDLSEQEVIAADQKRLVVDAFTRYRITDPVRFYQTVNNVAGANLRLGNIVNSTARAVLADATFTDIVREKRAALMREIRDDVNAQAQGFGISVVDVRLRRVDLPQANSQAVYQRMQTERQREAADIRANGSQIAQSIRARADRDVVVIKAEADRKAQELRGQGDAESNRIFAEAYGRDPDFFAFYRSMQAYETSLRASDTRLVLAPETDFFRYFGNAFGRNSTPARGGQSPAPQQPAPGPQSSLATP
ncbi:protease modulator HflC [Chelatococcus composti]|jgi:Membrane protease subunits, stomatin/prohibitin homologs|uniref:Protein HflC n=1 Tax=Chelatococcus composti TaxID=1743235 RepID=A0A841K1J9_9HYPH|nr:protease modulator HflC [Chelatococcus composti]MBB6166397.1 membrane protease subunit HflC [Chelatococcus composti]MBS7734672.1 protease modulator HflC [Chelatococcus composti]PZN40160.1 MAG: protease modulator HflC [Pseudomonadota bacterium]GGG28641.1 protein HflC [Chelatococcus composti]